MKNNSKNRKLLKIRLKNRIRRALIDFVPGVVFVKATQDVGDPSMYHVQVLAQPPIIRINSTPKDFDKEKFTKAMLDSQRSSMWLPVSQEPEVSFVPDDNVNSNKLK